MSEHIEFPHLTREANAALEVALAVHRCSNQPTFKAAIRKSCAAFLLETIKQATDNNCILHVNRLRAIANNLYSPPPPPTLAQARAADLDTPEGRQVVCAFLATIGEGGQL